MNRWFVNPQNPWFARGNAMNYGSGTGVFAFGNAPGSVYGDGSFRVVLLNYGLVKYLK